MRMKKGENIVTIFAAIKRTSYSRGLAAAAKNLEPGNGRYTTSILDLQHNLNIANSNS